jgi:hypothetical protein
MLPSREGTTPGRLPSREGGTGAGATPGRLPSREAAPVALVTVGCGTGGVAQMAEQWRSEAFPGRDGPLFGLASVEVGQGGFARSRLFFVHVSPDSISGIKRAKATNRKTDVRRMVGDVAGEVTVTCPEEMALDHFVKVASKTGMVDTAKGVSIRKTIADAEARIAKHRRKVDVQGGSGRRTAADMGVAGSTALKGVKDLAGPFNWCLFAPSGNDAEPLKLVNAGSLSVRECARFLTPESAVYGLLRMGFGAAPYRRTKYIGISFCGPKAPVPVRVRFSSAKGAMERAFGPVSLTVQLSDLASFSLDAIIARVRAVAVVDGKDVHSVAEAFSEAAFLSALAEEAEAMGSFFDDAGEGEGDAPLPSPDVLPSAAECVEMVKGERLNWALWSLS